MTIAALGEWATMVSAHLVTFLFWLLDCGFPLSFPAPTLLS
jgi:hypothetical protein